MRKIGYNTLQEEANHVRKRREAGGLIVVLYSRGGGRWDQHFRPQYK